MHQSDRLSVKHIVLIVAIVLKKLLIISFVFVGILKISGDVSENGNINLSLKEVDSPIAILPGTKELSLTKLLDKEVNIDCPFAMLIFVRVH